MGQGSGLDFRLRSLEEDYDRDRSFSDRFLPEIQAIMVAAQRPTVRLSTRHEDVKRATDLVVESRRVDVAVRMRRFSSVRYSGEVTFRSRRASGAVTEVEKIFGHGEGDQCFYGFANADNNAIVHYCILDLHRLRVALAETPDLLSKDKPNKDKVTFFRTVTLARLTADCIIARTLSCPSCGAVVPEVRLCPPCGAAFLREWWTRFPLKGHPLFPDRP